MKIGKYFKLHIIFVLLSGLLIVSAITSIATYAIYENLYAHRLNEADKIIKHYQTVHKSILKDLSYLKLLNFTQNDAVILQKFEKFAQLIYDNNQFVNGISLVKQFKRANLEHELKEFSTITRKNHFKLLSIPSLVAQAKKSPQEALISVLLSRVSSYAKKDIIGLELSSEEKRQRGIHSMNITGLNYLTSPVRIVNEHQGYKYSSILYYPLHKKKGDAFFKWYAAIPITSQKVLNLFIKEHYYSKNYIIDIYEIKTQYSHDYVKVASNEPGKREDLHIIKKDISSFGNKEQKIVISLKNEFCFEHYWPVILGFISGIFFLIGIGYYLYYKETKESQITFLAQTDYLTKLYNRIFFDEKIQENIYNHQRYDTLFSLIILDIDHFKKINDNFGHTQGDNVLISLAKFLQSSLRTSDFLARWGGEEFVILLPNTTLQEAIDTAQKLRIGIEQQKWHPKYTLTCSFGVTQVIKDDTASSIFARVDQALYKAKEKGRNNVQSKI
jgi:diguanylate cyclase (GGDEF)-like protein